MTRFMTAMWAIALLVPPSTATGVEYFPTEPGKSWHSTAYQSGTYAVDDSVTLFVTVIGPARVSVPAGEFDVIELSLYYNYHADGSQSRSEALWLHRQLGPVQGLESWSGVVSSENTTWGDLKARFR